MILTLVGYGLMALGQARVAGSRPVFDSFEVATIKPVDPGQRAAVFIRMEGTNRFVAKNYTVKRMIGWAYNLAPRAISGGPGWVEGDHFEIAAVTPGEVRPTMVEQMGMLRGLLADRFELTFHRETKVMPVYALTVAKGGALLKESAGEGAAPLLNTVYPDHVGLPARHATMGEFASMLQRAVLDRPVLDQTGLAGRYDFDLEWTPDDSQFGGELPMPAEAVWPGLFAAVQQTMGLRLQATNGPVEVLVIDRVQRPSAN